MPGGLTRIAASADTLVVSMQKGGGSKDTWVLSTGPVSTFSLLPATVQPVELSRDGGDLPSRAADNLFWLGRYVERAEATVRLLRGILVRRPSNRARRGPRDPGAAPGARRLDQDLPRVPRRRSRRAAPGTRARDCSRSSATSEISSGASPPRSTPCTGSRQGPRPALARHVADPEQPRDRAASLRLARPPAVQARPTAARQARALLNEALDRTVITLAAFGGLVADSMTRGQGWRFLDMGRQLERRSTRCPAAQHPGRASAGRNRRSWRRCWRSPTAR